MRIGSLFSGIGGLELGLERAGVGEVAWQVERDPFCRKVLARHWPEARRYDDVREVGAHNLAPVDLICGGFPCQDISDASRGRGEGIHGAKSGLWRELVRVADELSPRWLVVENVAGAAGKVWLPVVRRALWSIGYANVPVIVSAAACGAPFTGDRIFLAASYGNSESTRAIHAKAPSLPEIAGEIGHWREPAPWHLGMADGIPHRVDRLRACGNAVVPQVAEVIGRLIVEHR